MVLRLLLLGMQKGSTPRPSPPTPLLPPTASRDASIYIYVYLFCFFKVTLPKEHGSLFMNIHQQELDGVVCVSVSSLVPR